MKNKKILIYSLIVFILAGLIVVLLKGFNVDFMLRSHDSVEYKFETEVNLEEIKQIVKEQLGKKRFNIRIVETFNDTISINSLEITEEEKNNIVSKLNEKYGNEVNLDELQIISNPGLRLRQIIKPYIVPSAIAIAIIYATYCIRFYKNFDFKKIAKSMISVILIDLVIISIVAIFRIPVTTIFVPILLFVTLFSIIFYFEKEKINFSKESKE